MSKSILVVICDFLVLSIISIVDFSQKPDSGAEDKKREEVVVAQNFADAQMVDLLKMSLDSEREKREALKSDVEKLSQAAKDSLEQADRQRKIIAAREKQLEEMRMTKESVEREKIGILQKSRELEERVSASESRNAALQLEILGASRKLEKSARERIDLQKQLGDMRETDAAARMKLESVQAELKANKENLERLRKESEALKLENRAIEAEKSALATRLEVASTKTRIYEENLKRAQALVDIEKTEKKKILVHADKLAAGVNELAASQKKMESSQKEITREVKDLRPQTPSEVFSKIKPSLVSVTFSHTRRGILGPSTTQTQLRGVPVKIGGKYWLAFAADSTALAPTQNQYFPPEKMSVSVSGNSYRFEPLAVYSLANDPRLLAIQVPAEFIEKEKISPLTPADGFFRFPDCIVVNSKDLYYGQVPFRADYKNPSYARLDVGLLQSVFGTFSPSAGDIVISRTGEFLGFMAESDIASLISELKLGPALPMGDKYTPAGANIFVGQISQRLRAVPYSLK